MITDFLFLLLYSTFSVLLAPIKLLSDVTLPSGLTTALTSIGGYTSSLNNVIPMDTLFMIFGLILTIEAVIATYKIIMWVIKKLPFIGG